MEIYTSEMVKRYATILRNFLEGKEYVLKNEENLEKVSAKLLKNKFVTTDDLDIVDGPEKIINIYRIAGDSDYENLTNEHPWATSSTVLFMCEKVEYVLKIKGMTKGKRVQKHFLFSGIGEKRDFDVEITGRANSLYEELSIDDNRLKGYIFTAKLKKLVDIYNCRGEYLFQKNVRFSLDEDTSDVAKEIIGTLNNNPEEFWYLNNGITIISNSAIDIVRSKNIKLTYDENKDFYIINGAQTVSAAHKFFFDDNVTESKKVYAEENAFVVLRVVVTESTNAKKKSGINFDEKMSISLNRQKPIKPEDLAYYSPYVRVINQIYDENCDTRILNQYFKIVRRGEEQTNDSEMHSLTRLAKALFVIEKNSPKDAKNTSSADALALENNQLSASIFKFANGKNDDEIINDINRKYTNEYKYVNWVIACEKVYSIYIEQYIQKSENKNKALGTECKIFLRNGNWYFVAYMFKNIITQLEEQQQKYKFCTEESMHILLESFEKFVITFIENHPDEEILVSSFKKNNLYEKFIKFINSIKEDEKNPNYKIFNEAHNQMINAMVEI